jgi:hypothetical protein
MTVHRQPLLVGIAAAVLLCPACITIQADTLAPVSSEQSSGTAVASTPRTDFAVFPSRPGEVVTLNAESKRSTAQRIATEQKPETTVKVASESPGQFPVSPIPPTPGAEPPVLAAVRAQVEGRPDKAIEALGALDKPNQEFVLALLPVLMRGATGDLVGDPTGIAALVDQLQTTASQLEPRAALKLENVGFCRRVDGYGHYEPWPENQPYRPYDRAQLYLEVRNLTSQPTVGPRGETHVTYARATVEIRDAHGVRVKQRDREGNGQWVDTVQYETKRYTRGPLHDFHMLYPFQVPTTPGVYTVTVEIRDPVSRRSVKTKPIRFDVAGP